MNTENLKKVYGNLSDEKLKNLYREKETLNPSAIPLLEEELKTRNLLDELKAEAREENPDYNFADEEELSAFVEARLAEGESLESIRLDLLDHNIDIKRDFQKNFKREQEIMDYHLDQSAEGKPREEVYEEIKNKYNIGEEDIQRIKQTQKPTGALYQAAGIFLNFMGVVSILLFLYYVTEGDMPVMYLFNSALFFFLAHKALTKYRILNADA